MHTPLLIVNQVVSKHHKSILIKSIGQNITEHNNAYIIANHLKQINLTHTADAIGAWMFRRTLKVAIIQNGRIQKIIEN